MRYLLIMLVSIAAFTGRKMEVTSKAFINEGTIPVKYTCAGENVSPPLTIRNIPFGTRTLALIVEHPNTSKGDMTEWIAWNIIPDGVISEDNLPGITGKNSGGMRSYTGACPKDLQGLHHYKFRIYAIDKTLKLDKESDRAALEAAMAGHILETAELTAHFGSEAIPPVAAPRAGN